MNRVIKKETISNLKIELYMLQSMHPTIYDLTIQQTVFYIEQVERIVHRLSLVNKKSAQSLNRKCIALIQELENHYDFLAVMSENEFLGK